MGKNNRHMKFLRKEKSKVQLKASKKLTKGQNITDTSFKVKKIVLQNQLTTTPDDQPQNKKNLNLKELLSRSKHHNVNMRLEALSGLRELAVMHPEVLTSNLCNFLETSAARCSNEDSHLVRQESLRLLHYVLDKVSTAQLEPFIAMLILHLSTGMTHLQRGIQEDALRMLDIVLAVAPNLVAQAAPILLPAFLDQISVKQATGKRTLSLNLQSSHTSTNWRIKVLGRLHAMLSATSVCNASADTAVAEAKEIVWTPNCSPYVPLYVTKCDKPCTIQGVFPTGPTDLRGQQNLFQDEAEMKKYVSILVPLLFEIWAEVGPSQKQQRDVGSVIPPDAAELLDCILETLQHLWQYMEMSEKGTNAREMSKWFCQSFRVDFLYHLVEHFPYYTTVDQTKKARRSKGQSPFEQEPEISCHKQNLAICYLFCCLCNKPTNKQAQSIHSYTTKCLSAGQRITPQLVQVLECMLLKESSQFEASGMSTQDLAATLVNCCVNKTFGNIQKSPLFSLLCDLSLSEMRKKKSNLNVQRSIYSKFVEELPSILIQPVASAKGLKTICQLAAAQDTSLLQSVKLYLPKIVENLHELNVEGVDQRTMQTAVLGVFYQASVWRVDILDTAALSLMAHRHHLEHLICQFKQLMQLKLEREPLCQVSQKLLSMQWFYQK